MWCTFSGIITILVSVIQSNVASMKCKREEIYALQKAVYDGRILEDIGEYCSKLYQVRNKISAIKYIPEWTDMNCLKLGSDVHCPIFYF